MWLTRSTSAFPGCSATSRSWTTHTRRPSMIRSAVPGIWSNGLVGALAAKKSWIDSGTGILTWSAFPRFVRNAWKSAPSCTPDRRSHHWSSWMAATIRRSAVVSSNVIRFESILNANTRGRWEVGCAMCLPCYGLSTVTVNFLGGPFHYRCLS